MFFLRCPINLGLIDCSPNKFVKNVPLCFEIKIRAKVKQRKGQLFYYIEHVTGSVDIIKYSIPKTA